MKKLSKINAVQMTLRTGIIAASFGATLIFYQGVVSADSQIDAPTQTVTTNTKADPDSTFNVADKNSSTPSTTIPGNDSGEGNATTTNDGVTNKLNADNSEDETAITSTDAATSNEDANSNEKVRTPQTDVSDSDAQNQGNLDNISIENDQLNVSGWHATNYADGRNNNFIIVYDATTNTEISRQQVDGIERNDVDAAFPDLNNAKNSGFSTSFNFTSQMAGDEIRIVSRYSASLDGNSDYVDYWFAPIVFNKNDGRLENVSFSDDGTLVVRGWHAADQSAGKDNHFLILFDKTTGQQISQTNAESSERTDIKNVYPGFYNEDNSGYHGTLNLNGVNITDDLALVSRFSSSENGNGSGGAYVDHWFDLPTYDNGNYAALDNFSFNGSDKLNASGWHATNQSIGKDNHYVILFDSTTGREVQTLKVTTNVRGDVGSAFPAVLNGSDSGFIASFDFNNNLIGHNLVVVDRYSTSSDGNGGGGQTSDYWFSGKVFNNDAYSIDSFNSDLSTVHLNGWLASDYSAGEKYGYIIVLDAKTSQELTRNQVEFYERADVGRANADIYNSSMSGFSVDIPVTSGMSGNNIKFILRLSSDINGNSHYRQVITKEYSLANANEGYLENFSVNNGQITISGWHAADGSYEKPYHFIVLWDATNGVEISRTLVKDQSRSDVGRAYPSIYDANNSGFGLTTAVNDSNNNRILQVVSRYSDSSDGEGNKTDYWYANKLINGHVPYIALGAENINQYAWGAQDGCEPAALLEGLHLKGYATNLNYAQFLAQMPISNGNPYTGFGGSAYNGSGFPAIAPSALANWGRNYGNVTDISGSSVDQIKDQILNGNPVVAYVSIHFVNTYAINYWFGSMAYQNHAVLVDGYNDNAGTIHVSDPIDGSYWLSQLTFSNVYNVMKRAVVIA